MTKSNLEYPKVNEVFIDANGRNLIVSKCDMRERNDRHVQGKIIIEDDSQRDYSCSLTIWADIWRDKNPRLDPSKMKIG